MDFKIFPVLFVVFYQFLQEPIFLSNVEPSEQPSSNIDKQDFLDSDICQTEGCTMAASQLISFMDKTADPCTDFYQYACGNFSANAVISDHRTSVSLGFSVIQDKINERLKRLFEGENFASEPKIFQQVRNFYHSCMDKETIENNSVNELKEILTNVGGWPVLEGQNWNGGDFKWNELASRLSQEGLDSKPMILIGILPDEKDSLRNKIWIDEPWLGLSREYLIKGFNDKDVQAYYNYMVKTAVFLGAQEDVAEQEMKEALEFELKLAELSLPREERRNETALYNPMTLAEVQNLYPEIPMNNFISGVLGSNDDILEENEVVNVAVPKYITDFRNLITTVPARVQANYMVWRSIMNKMGYLNDSALKIKLAYEKNLWGITQEAPRWEKCVGSTRSSIVGQAVGSMYVREFFKINSKNVTNQIVDNVLEEFKIMLNESNWIDSKTKLEAIKKVDAITSHIAYQYEILDDSLMNEFYKHIDLKKESYLKNKIQLNQFHLKNNLENLRKPIDPMSWKTRMQAYMVNAEYNPHENSINIPAGIIDGVWFDTDRPQYMNYGALGLVIGHELTHGFDDMGSQWDAKGMELLAVL